MITPAHGPERGRGGSEALVRRRGRQVPKGCLEGQASDGASSFVAGPRLDAARDAAAKRAGFREGVLEVDLTLS